MKFNEQKGNLFELEDKYVLAHCISLDCEMGKGIAVEFDKRFSGMKVWLKRMVRANSYNFPIVIPAYKEDRLRVFNLITKEKYWHKPTYETITKCIREMAEYCARHNIKYLAIPKIGCGLDRLQWGELKK